MRGMETGSLEIDAAAGSNLRACNGEQAQEPQAAPAGRRDRRRREPAPPGRRAATRARARATRQPRAALRPLRPGERPTAVTVGAIAATLLALANLIALVFGYNAGEDTLSPGSELTGTLLVTGLLALMPTECGGRATGRCSGCRPCSR